MEVKTVHLSTEKGLTDDNLLIFEEMIASLYKNTPINNKAEARLALFIITQVDLFANRLDAECPCKVWEWLFQTWCSIHEEEENN